MEIKQPFLNSMNFSRKTLFDFKLIFFSMKFPWWVSLNLNCPYFGTIRYLNHLICLYLCILAGIFLWYIMIIFWEINLTHSLYR
jgi:hypothetical protein